MSTTELDALRSVFDKLKCALGTPDEYENDREPWLYFDDDLTLGEWTALHRVLTDAIRELPVDDVLAEAISAKAGFPVERCQAAVFWSQLGKLYIVTLNDDGDFEVCEVEKKAP